MVDDERLSNEYMDMFFREHFNVVCAESIKEAMVILNSENIDCVITDYYLPDGTGAMLLETIKNGMPKIKRLMVTGSVISDVEDIIHKETIDKIFGKPVDMDNLLDVLNKILH